MCAYVITGKWENITKPDQVAILEEEADKIARFNICNRYWYHFHNRQLQQIWAMVTAPDGIIWVAGEGGFIAYWDGNNWVDGGQWCHGEKAIGNLTIAPDGSIWAISAISSGNYIARWDGEKWEEVDLWPQRLVGGDINDLVVTPDGIIWAGGDDGYLAYWNGSKWVNCERWFCEKKGIMQKVSGLVFDYYFFDDDYDDYDENEVVCSCIQALTVAPDGSIWAVASGNDIARWVYKK